MGSHPIESIMSSAMTNIKELTDVDTIIGKTINLPDGGMIIPISKVAFGFAAGGSEFKSEALDEYTKQEEEEAISYKLPFGRRCRIWCSDKSSCIFSGTKWKCKINAS